jgi:hypothetical protein
LADSPEQPISEPPRPELLPGTPARGFPYPASSDPVAQGASAIQALAEAVSTRVGSTVIAVLGNATPVTTDVAIPFNAEFVDHWNGFTVNTSDIWLPGTGIYLFTLNVVFAGATGDGGTGIRVEFIGTDGNVADVPGRQEGAINADLSCSGVYIGHTNERLRAIATAGATGTGHSMAPAFFSVVRVD